MSWYLDGDDNEEGPEPGPGGDDIQRQRRDINGYPDREYRDRGERSQRFNLLVKTNHEYNKKVEVNKTADFVDRRRAKEIRRDKNRAGAEIA